jgi:hypothetical protein
MLGWLAAALRDRRRIGMITQRVKSLVHRCLAALGYRLERLPGSAGLRSPARRHPRPADDSILRLAKEHLEASTISADLPPLGDRWGAYASRLRARIRRVSSLEELIFLGQSGEAGIEKHWGARELAGHCRNFDLQLSTDLPAELYDALPRSTPRHHSPGLRHRIPWTDDGLRIAVRGQYGVADPEPDRGSGRGPFATSAAEPARSHARG